MGILLRGVAVTGLAGLAFTAAAPVSEWAGSVAIFGKAENEPAWSGCGFGIYYTGNRKNSN